VVSLTVCKDCNPGQYSEASASKCEKCEAGKYNSVASDVTGCEPCPEGMASNSGDSSCYKIADIFDRCEDYGGTGGGIGSVEKENRCHYLYAGHWVERKQGEDSPFGRGDYATCDSYVMCGAELGGGLLDHYYVMCADCNEKFHNSSFNTEYHWEHLDLENPVLVNPACSAGTKPTLCYDKSILNECINTKVAGPSLDLSAEIKAVDINCEYMHEGEWKKVDAGDPSPFNSACANYTICSFEQDPEITLSHPAPTDTYYVQCDDCIPQNVGGLYPQGDYGLCKMDDLHPSMCYPKDQSFSSCPEPPDSDSSIPSWVNLPTQQCKYMHNKVWERVDAGDSNPFVTTGAEGSFDSCKEFEFCAAEQGNFGDTTFKIACKECKEGYLPADPSYPAVAGNMGSCTEDYYPSTCYQHTDVVSDWQKCPLSTSGQQIECQYWHEGQWVKKEAGKFSPFGDQCGGYKMCHTDIEGSMTKDIYWLVCLQCGDKYFEASFEKPNGEGQRFGSCADYNDMTDSCLILPTNSPTPAPTRFLIPVPPPVDKSDDYVSPDDDDNGPEITEPKGLVARLRVYLGGNTNYAVGGFIFMCVVCGFGAFKTGCGCCSTSVEYDDEDSDEEDSEYTSDDESGTNRDSNFSDYSRKQSDYDSDGSDETDDMPMAKNPKRGGVEMRDMEKGRRR
jgi:hypothetical protein